MATSEIYAAIEATASVVLAVATVYNVYLAWNNSRDIKEVKHATNSMKDALVEAAHKDGVSVGLAEGRAEKV